MTTPRLSGITTLAALLFAAGAAHAQTYQAAGDDSLNVPPLNMTVGELDGLPLRNADGQRVGEVEDVLVRDGTPAALAVEVGGFLGIGDETVVVPLGHLSAGSGFLTTDMTEDELEALPEWED